MLERDVQERFIGFISGEIEIPQANTNPIRIYKELVHYRFDEVIRNAMPDFSKVLGEERLDKLIFDFIQSKPQTPYVWQVPSLFMNYLLDFHHVDDISYASDLMWFESIEVDLLMGRYEKPRVECFNWKTPYVLSSSMRMKVLNYAVNKAEFEYVQEHPLLMYYHFKEHGIYFQEITLFMYKFLSYLQDRLPYEALSMSCEDFEIEDVDEARELLQEALEEFASLSIIKPN